MTSFLEGLSPYTTVIILLVIVAVCKILLDLYLKTRSGYLLRAVGDNEILVTSLAKDKGMVKVIGLAIANGFAALAGSVYCHQNGFFEISSGTGTMVIGLASVIIGTKLFKAFPGSKGDDGCDYRFYCIQGVRIHSDCAGYGGVRFEADHFRTVPADSCAQQ